MTKKSCYLCGSQDYFTRDGRVRDNPKLEIHECSHCGLVFLSPFEQIKDRFYENSGMLNAEFDIAKYRRVSKQDSDIHILRP